MQPDALNVGNGIKSVEQILEPALAEDEGVSPAQEDLSQRGVGRNCLKGLG